RHSASRNGGRHQQSQASSQLGLGQPAEPRGRRDLRKGGNRQTKIVAEIGVDQAKNLESLGDAQQPEVGIHVKQDIKLTEGCALVKLLFDRKIQQKRGHTQTTGKPDNHSLLRGREEMGEAGRGRHRGHLARWGRLLDGDVSG
ncbi:MAG: hypothetical protein ACK56I_35340, partial [bacterium]